MQKRLSDLSLSSICNTNSPTQSNNIQQLEQLAHQPHICHYICCTYGTLISKGIHQPVNKDRNGIILLYTFFLQGKLSYTFLMIIFFRNNWSNSIKLNIITRSPISPFANFANLNKSVPIWQWNLKFTSKPPIIHGRVYNAYKTVIWLSSLVLLACRQCKMWFTRIDNCHNR